MHDHTNVKFTMNTLLGSTYLNPLENARIYSIKIRNLKVVWDISFEFYNSNVLSSLYEWHNQHKPFSRSQINKLTSK
jgi:hypothetical protein